MKKRNEKKRKRNTRKADSQPQGYDHSYFFISTFGEDHVKHAAKALGLL